MSNSTTITPSDWRIQAADHAEKNLRRWVRRQNRWFLYCRGAGPKCQMPSKASKHQAYSDAGQMLRLRRSDARLPETFSELCALVGEPCKLAR